jgi:glycosyltransferase involved in cell wall biosynthesis/ubiquinone/menaquinone biosynthesis C-methylase UbiE/predicted O-methyltransferase YrrM
MRMPTPSNQVPVSVCMPVHNGALYVKEAIRSVLKQTVMPQEIIISDSGSSDETDAIIHEEARRTKVQVTILPTKTPGMVANWNSTVRAASGKYIKFLFQDDLLHLDCLEKMVTLAASDERIGFVFSPRELLVEPSVEEDPLTKWLEKHRNLSAAFGQLKTSQPGSLLLRSQKLLQEPLNKIGEPTAVLIRTCVLREAGFFNERMCQLVDMEMWIRLMAISHVGFIPRALTSVRVHAQQASTRHISEEIDRFERSCLCDTLRAPTIYPLLHWRVRRELRRKDRRTPQLSPSRVITSVQRNAQAIASYACRYTAALVQLRRVRSVAPDVTFEQAYAFAKAEIGIVQKRAEIQWLFELVRAARPRVVLEIGLDFGGTFFLWSRAAAPDAHLLAIDASPVGRFGDWSPFSIVRRGFALGSQRVTLLMDSDCHSETTRARVAASLHGHAIDFLFIDGDHTSDGVLDNFKTYSPFVAPGGLIAFHDISQNPAEWTKAVAQFWREFTIDHETEERVVNDEPGFGIGVYRVPFDRPNLRSKTASGKPRVSGPVSGLDPLIPPNSLHSVGSLGSADFVAVGEEFFGYFADLCQVKPNDRVLDVGSGTGRMARPLTRYLKGGSYDGIDIVASSVQWCQSTYTSRYPNFRFHFADIYNKAYNPDGKYNATEYRLPFGTSSFDFVFLTSVFTHMLPQDVEHYLSEVARVLKPGKQCLITYFLINPAVTKLINEGFSHYSFKYELPGCRIESADTPEAVVGYDESTVRALYAKYGLNITEPVLYGTWCKKRDGFSWQDMIIATNSAHCG